MKKFFLVYGLLLLGLFAAFSYLESKTKDERILAAKLRHTFQLNKPGSCKTAFNLLSQRNQPALKRLYENRDMDALQAKFCSLWAKDNVQAWSVEIKSMNKPGYDYKVRMTNDNLPAEHYLFFLKKQSELALVRID